MSPPRPTTRGVLLALFVCALGGCSMKRTLSIESCPPCARVWVNGEDRGRTPVVIPFVHYGYFDVRLEKRGYESVATEVLVPTQTDGYPLIDLPLEMTKQERHFLWRGVLQPIPHAGEAEVRQFLDEARAFRQRTLREARETTPVGRTGTRPR